MGSSLRHEACGILCSGAAVLGLGCPQACGILALWSEMEPAFLCTEGRFLTPGPPGKSWKILFSNLLHSSGACVLCLNIRAHWPHCCAVNFTVLLGKYLPPWGSPCLGPFQALPLNTFLYLLILAPCEDRIPGPTVSAGVPSDWCGRRSLLSDRTWFHPMCSPSKLPAVGRISQLSLHGIGVLPTWSSLSRIFPSYTWYVRSMAPLATETLQC